MRLPFRPFAVVVSILALALTSAASAYNARPKLVVIIVIDQFRADYLDRYHDQFADSGFRTFLDHGAWFTNCNYDYANTRTAPGHATLLTGTYTVGHGIGANEWWDPQKKRMVTSVQDDDTQLVGISDTKSGSSPHNLLADTLGDELKLATQGKAQVFGVSLKDRAAVLPAGYAGDGAYWIDPKTGAWVTSTYYRADLPPWVKEFNSSSRAGKYWNRDWKDSDGNTLRSTAPRKTKDGSSAGFYDVVGSTPFANDYEFEFARELVLYEKLGAGEATDLLIVSLSANDILGHQVGPDTPGMKAMALALDRQLSEFFNFLGHQVGLANIWMVLSADHGVAPLPAYANGLRIHAANLGEKKLLEQINTSLASKIGSSPKTQFVKELDYPLAFLDQDAFPPRVKEEDAEQAVGEALKQVGLRGYYTRSQLAQGLVPPTELGRKYAHSFTPHGGWYVIGVPAPFTVGSTSGTDHATPYTYDTHVPLAFYGIPFQPGIYRTAAEPIDLAATLAALLGINAPTAATGRVLIEGLAQAARHTTASPSAPDPAAPKSKSTPEPAPTQPAGGFR
jgi:predicted AlkP superfamily pyrophosphatase or phosphodiesterase